MHKLVFTITILIYTLSVGATTTEESDLSESSVNAKRWGITAQDWSRYEELMSGKGKFLWKYHDPITVLGLNARSPNERDRYAELLAKQEYTSTLNLILLDRAYNEAFNRLYGNIPAIDTAMLDNGNDNLFGSLGSNSTPFNMPTFIGEPGDRYISFVDTNNCPDCIELLAPLINSNLPGVSIDIHFTNSTRSDINRWAMNMGIRVSSVKDGKITLNPPSKLYSEYGKPKIPSLYFYSKSDNSVTEVDHD